MRKQFFEDDGKLDAGIRIANPFPIVQAPVLDQRAMDDLACIMAGISGEPASADMSTGHAAASSANQPSNNVVPLHAGRKTSRRWVFGALAAVAAALLVAVPISTSLNGAGKAIAAPLPPTHIKPPTLSTQEAVEKLVAAIKANPDPTNFKPGYFDMEHWESDGMLIPLDEQYLDPDIFDGEMDDSFGGIEVESDSRISIPTKNEVRRESDGRGSMKQTVGDPFSTTGENVEFVPFEGNAKPGAVATYTFEAGEMNMMHPKAPASSTREFYDRVYGGLRPDSAEVYDGPQGYIQTIGFMMTEWKLDQGQTAALLGTIPMIKGIKYMGTSTDRWNRAVMVFGVDTRREGDKGGIYRTMLMFDPLTGRLTNYAEEYLPDANSSDQPDFEFDTVVRYIAVSE